MKAHDAKKVSRWLRALDDLQFEIAEKNQHPDHDPTAYADDDLKPLPFMDKDARVKVMIELASDSDHTLHTIATVEVATLRRACAIMAQITKDQLADLGVVIE